MSAQYGSNDQSRMDAAFRRYGTAHQGVDARATELMGTVQDAGPRVEQRLSALRLAEEEARRALSRAQERMAPTKDLSEATAALVDYVTTQSPNEAWPASFGYLVTLSVAGLANARLTQDAEAEAAMLSNLYASLDALQARYSPDTVTMVRWSRTVQAFGPRPATPENPSLEHPHRTSLGRHIKNVRDLALKSFQAYYALDRGAVHVIRPA